MGCTIHPSKTANSRVLQETIPTMNERKGEKKGDASPNWPGPGQAKKEETKEKNLGSHHFNKEHSMNFILLINQGTRRAL
jgi:hypothetical protein